MADIENVPYEPFLAGLSVGLFSDDEIVRWIRGTSLGMVQLAEVTQAIGRWKQGPITGPIRTALRAAQDLPPVPGD